MTWAPLLLAFVAGMVVGAALVGIIFCQETLGEGRAFESRYGGAIRPQAPPPRKPGTSPPARPSR